MPLIANIFSIVAVASLCSLALGVSVPEDILVPGHALLWQRIVAGSY